MSLPKYVLTLKSNSISAFEWAEQFLPVQNTWDIFNSASGTIWIYDKNVLGNPIITLMLLSGEIECEKFIATVKDIYEMPFGKARRKEILKYIRNNQMLSCNNKYQFQTADPDIKYLLKKGKIKQFRDSRGKEKYHYARNGQSYIKILKNEK
jgi:hypothetical protein